MIPTMGIALLGLEPTPPDEAKFENEGESARAEAGARISIASSSATIGSNLMGSDERIA